VVFPKRSSVAVCPTVLIDDNPLQEVETQWYLDIIFDKNCSGEFR